MEKKKTFHAINRISLYLWSYRLSVNRREGWKQHRYNLVWQPSVGSWGEEFTEGSKHGKRQRNSSSQSLDLLWVTFIYNGTTLKYSNGSIWVFGKLHNTGLIVHVLRHREVKQLQHKRIYSKPWKIKCGFPTKLPLLRSQPTALILWTDIERMSFDNGEQD